MSKFIRNTVFFFTLIFFISACNSNPYIKDYIEGEDFVFNQEADISQVVSAMIEISEIRKGGYVVLLTTTEDLKPDTKEFKKVFHQQNIIAVHILNLKPDSLIQKTDIIAIENARILCVLGENAMDILNTEEYSQTKSLNMKAKESAGLFAVRE